MTNNDHLYLSKFEVDPEYDIFMDPIDDSDFFYRNEENPLPNENDLDDMADDIWEA